MPYIVENHMTICLRNHDCITSLRCSMARASVIPCLQRKLGLTEQNCSLIALPFLLSYCNLYYFIIHGMFDCTSLIWNVTRYLCITKYLYGITHKFLNMNHHTKLQQLVCYNSFLPWFFTHGSPAVSTLELSLLRFAPIKFIKLYLVQIFLVFDSPV